MVTLTFFQMVYMRTTHSKTIYSIILETHKTSYALIIH